MASLPFSLCSCHSFSSCPFLFHQSSRFFFQAAPPTFDNSFFFFFSFFKSNPDMKEWNPSARSRGLFSNISKEGRAISRSRVSPVSGKSGKVKSRIMTKRENNYIIRQQIRCRFHGVLTINKNVTKNEKINKNVNKTFRIGLHCENDDFWHTSLQVLGWLHKCKQFLISPRGGAGVAAACSSYWRT